MSRQIYPGDVYERTVFVCDHRITTRRKHVFPECEGELEKENGKPKKRMGFPEQPEKEPIESVVKRELTKVPKTNPELIPA